VFKKPAASNTCIVCLAMLMLAGMILHASQLGVSSTTTVLMFALASLLNVLSSYPAGIASDRPGRKGVLITGFVLFAAVYSGFGMARSPALLWGLFTVYGVYLGLTGGVTKALIVDFTPHGERGAALGLQAAVMGDLYAAGERNCGGVVAVWRSGLDLLIWGRHGHRRSPASGVLPGQRQIESGLTAPGECDHRLHGLAAAKHFHLHHVVGLLGAERISEVVKVLNGLAVEFHHHIAGFETRPGRG